MVQLQETPIPGLVVVRLDVHHDARGWFKEGWNREQMERLGLPPLRPLQHNVTSNPRRGTVRGLHAEPWTKLVSLTHGRALGAWVDLREGPGFGRSFHCELDPSMAVLVPPGVANGYQTLTDDTGYSYLVDDHWRADATYAGLHPADETTAIPWPLPLEGTRLSSRDQSLPRLPDVQPLPRRRPLILGAGGRLGRALARVFPDADLAGRHACPATGIKAVDACDSEALGALPWSTYDVVINAAAYTDVDRAETAIGRRQAWRDNVQLAETVVRVAATHGTPVVHFSSDYVFDGHLSPHHEEEPPSPLGVYGQTKAAADAAVRAVPENLVLRTSWLVGDGPSFVATMLDLARRRSSPHVVNDQFGRLTFTDELARATRHLVDRGATGTVNVSNSGEPTSWHAVAMRVFEMTGRDPRDVRPTSTAQRLALSGGAPRPASSVLDLSRLASSGFQAEDAGTALERYISAAQRREGAPGTGVDTGRSRGDFWFG